MMSERYTSRCLSAALPPPPPPMTAAEAPLAPAPLLPATEAGMATSRREIAAARRIRKQRGARSLEWAGAKMAAVRMERVRMGRGVGDVEDMGGGKAGRMWKGGGGGGGGGGEGGGGGGEALEIWRYGE